MNSIPKQSPNILVLGGGYAGLLAASGLRRELPNAQITLVDAQASFSHRVRRHEELVGQATESIDFQQFSRTRGIHFLQARVDKLEPEANRVQLHTASESLTFDYDQLVYALGSVSKALWQEPAPENVYALNDPEDILKAQQNLLNAKRLVIVGSGLSAIEYATEIAESFPSIQVKLLTRSSLLSGYSLAAQNYARSVLGEMGVDIIEHLEVVKLESNHCLCANGESIPFDLCISSAGFCASPVWRNSNLPGRNNGQIEVDGFLRAASYRNIWVAGDAAYADVEGQAILRMSCASACGSAPLMALNVARQQRGEDLIPHTPFYFCHCISLGRERGLIQLVTPDDKMLPTIVTGDVAVATKNQISDAVMLTLLWDGHSSQQGWWPDFEALIQVAA